MLPKPDENFCEAQENEGDDDSPDELDESDSDIDERESLIDIGQLLHPDQELLALAKRHHFN